MTDFNDKIVFLEFCCLDAKVSIEPPIPCCNSNFIWHQTKLGFPHVMLSTHSQRVLHNTRNRDQIMRGFSPGFHSMTIVHGLITPTTWQRTGNISFLVVTIPPWVNTNNVLFPGKSLSERSLLHVFKAIYLQSRVTLIPRLQCPDPLHLDTPGA